MAEDYRCEKCDKEFNTLEALEMHNNSKHYEVVKKPTDRKKVKRWSIFIAVLLIIFFGVYFYTTLDPRPGRYDEFAQCLTESGVKEYGAYWCGNCQKQKQMFGKSFQYIDYTECSLPGTEGQNEFCEDAGIENYPTWELPDGSKIEGLISLERLAVLTGCEV